MTVVRCTEMGGEDGTNIERRIRRFRGIVESSSKSTLRGIGSYG